MTLTGVAPQARAADEYLIASDPHRHQELKDVPGWVTLVFKTKASAKLAKIIVLNSSGQNVTTGALIVEGTNVTTQLDFELPKDTFTVLYRTSGDDGRARGGAFQFAYGKGKWTPLEKEVWVGEAEQPPVLSNPDPNATESPASPSASPSATISPSPTASGVPSPATTGSASPAPAPAGGTSWPWLLGGLLALVAAVGVGVAAIQRRRAG